jgi:hypothetical protein
MRTVTVTLAGKPYELQALPRRQAQAWRAKLGGPFAELEQALGTGLTTELTDGKGIADLVATFSGTLLGSVDLLVGLLYDFSPALREDRERIDEEAFDEELLAAFWEAVKLAFPFGGLVSKLQASGAKLTTSKK